MTNFIFSKNRLWPQMISRLMVFLFIDQRLDHVKNWKGELEVKRTELEKEVDATETYLVRIDKRLQSLQDNLHIAQTTLANR